MPVSLSAEKTTEKKLLLPEPYRYQDYVVSYLTARGIDTDIIVFCLQTGLVRGQRLQRQPVHPVRNQADKVEKRNQFRDSVR